MAKVSIVVPIYNVEKYLEQCVDSIINQTLKEIEIILVDDGSPDNCPQMCDEYAKKDSRIKVVHKKNGGLSSARNAGIEVATGDYIGFVDSDDYIVNDATLKLETWIKEIDDKDDIVAVGAARVYPNGEYIKGIEPNIDDNIGYLDATNLERKNYNLET